MGKFKTRKKYRLTFINENTFNAVWTVRLSRAKVWALSAVTVAAIAALILWLATATPLSTLLPGYLKPNQRVEHVNNTLRVDSLAELLAVNDAYLRNVTAILDGSVEQQADSAATRSEALAVTDTLMAASETERAFVEKWNSRERYNLSVLTPIAADAISLHKPVAGAAADSLLTQGSVRTLRMTAPRGAAVTAVARGTVVSVAFDDVRGHVVTLQHPGNLISVVGGIALPAVEPGRKLQSGEALGRSGNYPVDLTLWLDGTSLDPRALLPN